MEKGLNKLLKMSLLDVKEGQICYKYESETCQKDKKCLRKGKNDKINWHKG